MKLSVDNNLSITKSGTTHFDGKAKEQQIIRRKKSYMVLTREVVSHLSKRVKKFALSVLLLLRDLVLVGQKKPTKSITYTGKNEIRSTNNSINKWQRAITKIRLKNRLKKHAETRIKTSLDVVENKVASTKAKIKLLREDCDDDGKLSEKIQKIDESITSLKAFCEQEKGLQERRQQLLNETQSYADYVKTSAKWGGLGTKLVSYAKGFAFNTKKISELSSTFSFYDYRDEKAKIEEKMEDFKSKSLNLESLNALKENYLEKKRQIELETKTLDGCLQDKKKLDDLLQLTKEKEQVFINQKDTIDNNEKTKINSQLKICLNDIQSYCGKQLAELMEIFIGKINSEQSVCKWEKLEDNHFRLLLSHPARMWIPKVSKDDPKGGSILMLGHPNNCVDLVLMNDRIEFKSGFNVFVKRSPIPLFPAMELTPAVFAVSIKEEKLIISAGITFYGKKISKDAYKSVKDEKNNWRNAPSIDENYRAFLLKKYDESN